jgi:hypothetical protein
MRPRADGLPAMKARSAFEATMASTMLPTSGFGFVGLGGTILPSPS